MTEGPQPVEAYSDHTGGHRFALDHVAHQITTSMSNEHDRELVVLALVTVRQWGFVGRLSFIPRVAGNTRSHAPRRGPAPPRAVSRRSDRRERGRVVEGPWSAPTPPRHDADAAAAQAELDELLDKISAGGLDSLSAAEKRRLNELSKRLR